MSVKKRNVTEEDGEITTMYSLRDQLQCSLNQIVFKLICSNKYKVRFLQNNCQCGGVGGGDDLWRTQGGRVSTVDWFSIRKPEDACQSKRKFHGTIGQGPRPGLEAGSVGETPINCQIITVLTLKI